MECARRVVARLPKAYALGAFDGADGRSFVVGTEKEGPIRRFALDGAPMETIAEGPGGVMTIAQVPGRADQILATSRFFSPNSGGDEAAIVSYTRRPSGAWVERLVCRLPYVHRFGLLEGADGLLWLLACTIKGACRPIADDWLMPGAVWAAPLKGPLEAHDASHPLPLAQVASCQLQNHGFWVARDRSFALVTTAAGVFRYRPPAQEGGAWEVSCLIVDPTSDVCMVDLDGDGRDEMVTFSPFHGDTLSVWHEGAAPDTYIRQWTHPKRLGFLHAIWAGELAGRPCAVLGHRRGASGLFLLNVRDGGLRLEPLDAGGGPANCLVTTDSDGVQRIVAANRESDEVVLYEVLGCD